MTIDELRAKNCIIFECVSGSRAYNLHTPQSDTDIRGVFVLPKSEFFGLDRVEQVSNETNDIVFYEIGKFMELLSKNNPNILEMLAVSPQHILYKDPIFDLIQPDFCLSKLCKDTFAGYALTQIRKARGLNKKILNPQPVARKNILDFAYILSGYGTIQLPKWLEKEGLKQENCGLVNIPHAKNMFSLFYDNSPNQVLRYQGIMKKETANEVSLSSIPEGEKLVAYLSFNQDGYSSYCKEYREYWDWVEKRNDNRYQNTLSHGKQYDAKNMMHTFRLLEMAIEILSGQGVRVERSDREHLLRIKSGGYEFEELLALSEAKIQQIDALYEQSILPETPNRETIQAILVQIRTHFYS